MTGVVECVDCASRSYYPKGRCLECGGEEFIEVSAGEGELLAVTVVHVTPDGVREPNVLGLASFSGGANVIAQLDGDLEVGDAVRLAGNHDLRVTDDGTLRGDRLVPVE